MRVSVVTPVYNDPRVGRALASVRMQTFDGDLEHIVIDGGSSGKTVHVLEECRDDIDVLISEPDEGVYDAMNKGIDVASGDIVAILNADDQWQDRHVLADVLDVFRTRDADIVYGDKALVDSNDRVIRLWRAGPEASWRWYLGWMPPHPALFVHRRIYERHGKYKLEFPYAADYEFMFRTIRVQDIDVAYLPRVLTRFELGGQSNSSISDILKANREVYLSWGESGVRGGIIVPFLKLARRIGQYLRALPYRDVGQGAAETTRFPSNRQAR